MRNLLKRNFGSEVCGIYFTFATFNTDLSSFFSLIISELYIDEKKQTYKDLGYKRFSLMGILSVLFSRLARSQAAKVLLIYYDPIFKVL